MSTHAHPTPLAAGEQQHLRQLLLERLAELTARIDGIEAELQQPRDDDLEEQATDREGDEVLDMVERSARDEIARVRGALARLADGTYGNCLSCGAMIDRKRLLVMPTAAQCIACAGRSG